MGDALHDRCSSTSSCLKIYLCSNPEDSVMERRALRENVFPKFRRHCRLKRGLEVRVIDPFESPDPSFWPDENSREQLIRECRENSAGLFFMALVGHQYGAASLPPLVEVSEFQMLLQENQRAGLSTEMLEGAYQRDENTVPASYRLKHQPKVEGGRASGMKCAEEEELKKQFQIAVTLSAHSRQSSPERSKSFCRSALDKDLRFALSQLPVKGTSNRSVIYVHKVFGVEEEDKKKSVQRQLPSKPKGDLTDSPTPTTSPSSDELLSELCDSFLPGLVSSHQSFVYTFTTTCDRRHGYTPTRRRAYTDSLCQQVLSDLMMLNSNILRRNSLMGEFSSRQHADQKHLCNVLSRYYDIVLPQEEEVKVYLEEEGKQCPLVVTGESCTGKTVLLAHCSTQLQEKCWLADRDPVVVSCFSNLSTDSSPKHLLAFLCCQVASVYNHQILSKIKLPLSQAGNTINYPSTVLSSDPGESLKAEASQTHLTTTADQSSEGINSGIISANLKLSELKEHITHLLTLLPSADHPLVLMFDGLDHLEINISDEIIRSFPSPLPSNVKLILTVSSNRTSFLQTVKLHFSHHCSSQQAPLSFVELGSVDTKQSAKLMTSLLKRSGRKITSGQQALVNKMLASCRKPLYVRLLHALISEWHSDSDVSDSSLPGGIHLSISALLDHLEHKHNSLLVARAASLLTLSKSGLTEAELADLLSINLCYEHIPVSQVVVERLLLDLNAFVIRRIVAGSEVLQWVSRHFGLVVAKKYLSSSETRREIHSEMADYFNGRWWSCESKKDGDEDNQPFMFLSLKSEVRVNMRKILELSHHLEQSSRVGDLESGLLMSMRFHQAMLHAGLLSELITLLETNQDASKIQTSRERFILASILKTTACFLQKSPFQLGTVIKINLLHFLDVFPALEEYVRNSSKEGTIEAERLEVTLCPYRSHVSAIRCLDIDDKSAGKRVTDCAITGCGVLVLTMEDGSAWIWKSSGSDLKSLNCERQGLEFTGVDCSGGYVLLTMQCGRVFVWDASGPERLCEIETKPKSERSPSIGGFVACHGQLAFWWKMESLVHLYDVINEVVRQLWCQNAVTCFSVGSSSLYCGQDNGTMSIFDRRSRQLVRTCLHPNQIGVSSMILCEEKGELACIDKSGSVFLWQVAKGEESPKLVKEENSPDQSSFVNAECLEEHGLLLVCQLHHVTVWDMEEWEIVDQFLAPQGQSFTHAVPVQGGHLFMALLQNCSHVLVWKISSGECVLYLQANAQPFKLLRTTFDTICVSDNGSITVWDSAMIDSAGSVPKMKRRVKEIVVEQDGKWFYACEESQEVWKWSSTTGCVHGVFIHDAVVEKLQLSPNGEYLVSISAGDIYVWQTETGQNVVRIGGSGATNILTTWNGKFGVSISRQGPSQVWRMPSGTVVCHLYLNLSSPQVTSDNTFLVGLHCGDLLAASLWTGSISKRCNIPGSSGPVIAFHTVQGHPEFVLLMTASRTLYTWKIAEETLCQHLELPDMFLFEPQYFQLSSNGCYALLSIHGDTINLLDLSQVKLCSLKAAGPVVKAYLERSGSYLAYTYSPSDFTCHCQLHTSPSLTVSRLSDGKQMGSVPLHQHPSFLICHKRSIYAGFGDGSLGVYSVQDGGVDKKGMATGTECPVSFMEQCPFERPMMWFPQTHSNVNWTYRSSAVE